MDKSDFVRYIEFVGDFNVSTIKNVMIKYYRKSIIELLNHIHTNKNNPFENIQIWYNVQIELIKKLSYIENRIRSLNKDIKNLNYYRKNPLNKLSKQESITVKNKIDKNKFYLEEYRYLIKIYKSIGDAIAFTFIHKLNIKPQNFKQSPGFLTEKSGFRKEKQYFKFAFKNGIIAILNDLTSVLKYCDITLVTEDGYQSIEVKSSNVRNARIERQENNAEKIFNYLIEDRTENLYGNQGTMIRLSLESEEKNYIQELNKLIEDSKLKKNSFKLVESGVFYFVSREFNKDEMDKNFKDAKLRIPYAFSLNQLKFTEQGYYPFSLIFNNPIDYLDFLNGNFVIMIFIDLEIIKKVAKKYKYKLIESLDSDYPFEFESLKDNSAIKSFKISHHLFFRSVLELVSVKWLLEDSFKRFLKIENNEIVIE